MTVTVSNTIYKNKIVGKTWLLGCSFLVPALTITVFCSFSLQSPKFSVQHIFITLPQVQGTELGPGWNKEDKISAMKGLRCREMVPKHNYSTRLSLKNQCQERIS